jgi:hypothetical protein
MDEEVLRDAANNKVINQYVGRPCVTPNVIKFLKSIIEKLISNVHHVKN